MTDNTVGPLVDTAAGDIVSISVSPDGPYGVYFEPDNTGNAAVISSFERLPDGKIGILQRHGGLHLGDVLFAINDTYLESMPHKDVIALVKDRNVLKKTFRFMNNKEYYRKRKSSTGGISSVPDSRGNFLSSVRRYRISEDEYKRKFVEYEIACQLRIPGVRVQKDVVHKWILWKRYSDFEKLHNQLVATLGWQLEGIEFPSSYTFTFNKLAPDFIELRRDELNRYWARVTAIDKVTEFTKHHCSEVLKAFLDVDETIRNGKITNPDSIDAGGGLSDSQDLPPTNPNSTSAVSANRRSQRVQSMRRRNPNSTNSTNINSNTASTESLVNNPSRNSSNNSLSSSDSIKPPPPPTSNKPPPPPSMPTTNTVQSNVITNTNPAPTVSSTGPPPSATNNSNSTLPPKPTGARMNLLSQISSLKKID